MRRRISTHAPLAGRDIFQLQLIANDIDFNPRAPCGARPCAFLIDQIGANISTHAPLAGRDGCRGKCGHRGHISTHAPLAGRDSYFAEFLNGNADFNPRAPCGARRLTRLRRLRPSRDFNPRAPCGARLRPLLPPLSSFPFQPTRPLRGATRRHARADKYIAGISTHAPLAGRDSKSVQITMHIFAITDKFQMLLHRMPPVRAFCSFLMQENHADFGCEPPK